MWESDGDIHPHAGGLLQVIVGAHTLLANGGIMAPVGTAVVAMAAKKHAVPFVVLVGLHKLSPLYPHDPDVSFNDFKSPAAVIDYDVVAEPLEEAAAMGQTANELPASCVPPPSCSAHAPCESHRGLDLSVRPRCW